MHKPLSPAIVATLPLQGRLATYTPLSPAAALAVASEWTLDLNFTDLACGCALAESAEDVLRHLEGRPLIRLWRVDAPTLPKHAPVFVVFSEVTLLDCISLYQPSPPLEAITYGDIEGLSANQSVALFGDFLACFAAAVFADPNAKEIFAHLPLPLLPAIYAAYIDQGWDVLKGDLGPGAEFRHIFRLQRKIFELYHAPPVGDDEAF